MTTALIAAHTMVTSLGVDAATSCASARAGLVRTQAVEGLRFISTVDGQPAPVIVHAVPLLTRGFEGDARLERLLSRALADLKPKLPVTLADNPSVGFYLSVPSPFRRIMGIALMDSDATRATCQALLETMDDSLEDTPPDTRFVRRLLVNAAAAAGFVHEPQMRGMSLEGHAGGAQCVATAIDDLAQGRVELAIVAGVDSLLDEVTLQWLSGTSRLKLDDMPVGLRPGEACAVLALVGPQHAAAAGASCAIEQVALASEERSLLSGAISVGVAMAQAIDATAATASWSERSSPWLIHDHNGEVYRANEWGHAVVRLRAEHPAFDSPEVWLPAAGFGDTGAATDLVGACVALEGFERGYAPSDHAVVVSSSESRLRSAMVVGRLGASNVDGSAHGHP